MFLYWLNSLNNNDIIMLLKLILVKIWVINFEEFHHLNKYLDLKLA